MNTHFSSMTRSGRLTTVTSVLQAANRAMSSDQIVTAARARGVDFVDAAGLAPTLQHGRQLGRFLVTSTRCWTLPTK